MSRRPLRLTLGTTVLELLPDGRVLAVLPPTVMPFGAAMQATVIYRNLRTFLIAMRYVSIRC